MKPSDTSRRVTSNSRCPSPSTWSDAARTFTRRDQRSPRRWNSSPRTSSPPRPTRGSAARTRRRISWASRGGSRSETPRRCPTRRWRGCTSSSAICVRRKIEPTKRSPRSRRRRTTAPARTARRTCAPPSGTCVSRVATNESAITASASRFAGASSGCGWRRRAPPRLAFRSAKGSNGRWRPRRRTPRCRCGGNRRWRAWRR
mmetsp:Transcript_8540/g.34486  ORF Transcript_8540/g.34486 Transcript_8540/m.34486 type:complete len:202 (+) Transcript_8540:377-982(+)